MATEPPMYEWRMAHNGIWWTFSYILYKYFLKYAISEITEPCNIATYALGH